MRLLISLICLGTMAVSFTPTPISSQRAPIEYDIIIRNGRVVDGSGRPGFRADIAISGDRIARIARNFDLKGAKARREIDVRGQVVAPGFIDMLGQSEQFLLIDGRAMSKVMQGVTTEITGEGESIAPINDQILKEQEAFNRKYNLTVDWRTFDEYFKRLERQGIGVNLGTFVGATQVREYVIGYDNRPPTAAEMGQMKAVVADAMNQGALGLSTSLQYVPARFAKTDEIVELAKVARQFGGIYITHQRSEANAIDESMREVFEIARRANIPTEIWHFKTAYKKNWGRMPEMLRRIAAARRRGLKITADVYPYIAGSTSLSACLPPWAQEGGTDKMIARLRDMRIRQQLKKDISTDAKDWENIYLGSGGASGIQISSVTNRELEKWQGKRLSEVATAENKDPLDALLDFIVADHGQTGAIFFMMNEDDMKAALKSPFVSICTDTGARATDGPLSGGRSHPRGWGTYPRILGRYGRDEKLMSLETAIHKMTGMSAVKVGLKQRGLLREGYFADITIFDPKTVIDRATFEQPHQYPVGINFVIVNGQVEVDNGKRTPTLAGRVLRGPGFVRWDRYDTR
ncbi:MAG TPA: D-aminoacylase [Pyrinomonadaceae bacterium]|nr:D-aminoacylase [Pyrinomonadaceae bacterium]